MNMKFFKVLSVCSFVLLVTACGQRSTPDSGVADPEFRVESKIYSLLRAPQLDEKGAGHFIDRDENTIFIKDQSGTQTTTFNYTYGTTYHWSDIHLPQEIKQCQISACYPPVQTSDFKNFKWDVNKKKGIDLLLASPVKASTESSSPINLSFRHALHKLSVVLIPQGNKVSSDILSKAVITCKNVKSIAVIDLLNGKAITSNGPTIELTKNGATTNFLIPAQEVGDMEISINVEGREAHYQLSKLKIKDQQLKNLESGKAFSLQVKVSKESFTIVGQNISGWEKQGEADGTITL